MDFGGEGAVEEESSVPQSSEPRINACLLLQKGELPIKRRGVTGRMERAMCEGRRANRMAFLFGSGTSSAGNENLRPLLSRNINPQVMENMAPETTFDHWKVIFS